MSRKKVRNKVREDIAIPKESLDKKLEGYRSLTEGFSKLTLTELEQLLAREKEYKKRGSVILKIHQRLCTVRKREERKELMKYIRKAK